VRGYLAELAAGADTTPKLTINKKDNRPRGGVASHKIIYVDGRIGFVYIMALQAPLANDKKRVKVYELRDNDWYDRGTGFCTGQIINVCTLESCDTRGGF